MINDMETLSYVLFILTILAMIHFIYDGIIVPSMRFHLRNDLFSLRDQMRRLIIEGHLSRSDKETICFMDDNIGFFINKLPSLSRKTCSRAKKELAQNQELSKLIEERLNSIKKMQNYEVHDIYQKSNVIVGKALIFNSGPGLLFFMLISLLAGLTLITEFKKLISALVIMPPQEANRFI